LEGELDEKNRCWIARFDTRSAGLDDGLRTDAYSDPGSAGYGSPVYARILGGGDATRPAGEHANGDRQQYPGRHEHAFAFPNAFSHPYNLPNPDAYNHPATNDSAQRHADSCRNV
jgi:hypothetical protein